MNFNEVRTIVRDYVNVVAANVDQYITDSVNFLSFIFPKNKIDITQTVAAGDTSIAKPSNCLKIRRLVINDVEVPEADFNHLADTEDVDVLRWYEDDDLIQLTIPISATVAGGVKIWYIAGFMVNSVGDWTETQPAGNVDHPWKAVASDSDGSNLIAAGYDGLLYVSNDFGLTWTERTPDGVGNKNWLAVASDSDGSNLIASNDTKIFTSSDFGVTWTERQPAGAVSRDWQTVASDSDGSVLIAASHSLTASLGRVYTSSDFGVTWAERQPAGAVDRNWKGAAMSGDGDKMVISAYGGRLFTSIDIGVTWTERQPAGDFDKYWYCVASDSDGSNLFVGVMGGRLYTSADSGVTWTERQPIGNANHNWSAVVSDYNGSHLATVASNGRLWISTDGGLMWIEAQKWGVNLEWQCLASDLYGNNLIAGIGGDSGTYGRLFIYSTNPEIDINDGLGELIYVGAAYRYYRRMVSIKVTSPTTYPDIEIDELRKVLEYWKDDYYKLLDRFIVNNNNK